MHELVRVHALDGALEVGGVDRARGISVEGLNCTWDKWGSKTARWTFRRDPGAPWPDLSPWTPLDIYKNGLRGWRGFVEETPQEDDYSISVNAIGLQDHGDHDPYRRLYTHAKLADWRDSRSLPNADLDIYRAVGNVSSGEGGLTLGFPKGADVENNVRVGATFDAGPGNTIARVVYAGTGRNDHSANIGLRIVGTDTPNPLDTGAETILVNDPGANNPYQNGPAALDLTIPRRYLHVYLINTGGDAAALAGEVHLRFDQLLLVADTAYESGGASTLKAHHILIDGLPFCPLWSQDTSSIDDQTSFSFPEFAFTDDRTFREIAEAVNAPHRYVLKLDTNGRLIFKPQPSVPMFIAGAEVSFKDASKNSARDIYNKATGNGVDPAGEQVKVERRAADQPQGLFSTPSDLSHPNPSFDVDTAGWNVVDGSMARVTSNPDSAPGCLNLSDSVAPERVEVNTSAFSGTWRKGQEYRIRLRVRKNAGGQQVILTMAVGSKTEQLVLSTADGTLINGSYVTADLFIRPIEATTSATLTIVVPQDGLNNLGVLIDSLEIHAVAATIVDRRGFTRSKALSTSQAIDTNTLQTMLDVWLQGHKRAPLKGDLEVVGRSLKRYLGGAGVDPFEIGMHTQELVHLAGEIDPDTGNVGRDAPIAQVTYDGDSETAQVSLDATRENFEAVVSRFEMVAGAGR